MIRQRLYLQISGLFIASLLVFAILASFAWAIIDRDQGDRDLFVKSAALSEMLIPHIDESQSIQKEALDKIHLSLDFDLSLYTEKRALIATGGSEVKLSTFTNDLTANAWQKEKGGTHWVTKLQDGRFLAINVERIQLPGESAVFAIFLGIIAAGVAIIMYPFIRHVTGRLERLQLGVQQIGSGKLNARVAVEGSDEIAQVAVSFNDAAQRIQELINAQHLLLANASHELRTPLSRIRLGIEMLEKQNTPERIQGLQVDIAELDMLIEELTLLTRIDSGVGTCDFEKFDVMALVAEECARYENCECAGHPVEIKGDRRMIQRAIRNLIDNGIKHGAPPITVEVAQENNRATVSVGDCGSGISDIDTSKMFEPFQRGRGKQNISGSGLGLTLVKKIAELHQGSVEVRNKPSSTVILILGSG